MIRRLLLAASIAIVAVSATAAETLRGGSTAPLALSIDRLPRGAEEWEAFLSLDGGAHYTIRITPHLDLAVRRVTWIVPNVDAASARIMIRAGDERDETAFELPESFAIARDTGAPLPPMRAAPLTRAEPGVAAWAEGDRAGTRVTLVTSAPPPTGVESVRSAAATDDAPFDAPKAQLRAACCASRLAPGEPTRNAQLTTRNSKDILLLSTRLNV